MRTAALWCAGLARLFNITSNYVTVRWEMAFNAR
jgi:hypothetical protein